MENIVNMHQAKPVIEQNLKVRDNTISDISGIFLDVWYSILFPSYFDTYKSGNIS